MTHSVKSHKTLAAGLICLLIAALPPAGAAAEDPNSALWIRRHTGSNWAEGKFSIPADAVSVFTYEGRPRSVHVTDKYIAADYGVSGVLFDVGSGKMVRRYTVAHGWPDRRPEAFGPKPSRPQHGTRLVDPGVVAWRYPHAPGDDRKKPPLSVADEAKLGGRTFRAMQPTLHDIQRNYNTDGTAMRKKLGRWKAYLDASSRLSCIEAVGKDWARPYTTTDGLAGNIVSRLVVSGGTLWAACVDIYDDEKKAWGPGGLCRYDARNDWWIHVKTVNGKPVRWVTLLEAHGDELWVGFREGQGIVGEKIVHGMGLSPGLYRPKVTAIVLARLKNSKWTVWSRGPRP